MFTIIAAIVCAVCALYYIFKRKVSNFPPGPISYPFVGSLPILGDELHEGLQKQAKKYGPIVGFGYGPHRAVCLQGGSLIKEAFNNPAFDARIDTKMLQFIFGDTTGILFSAGDTWSEQRRFALRQLRNFGYGKTTMEELILDEVKDVIKILKKQDGKPVELNDIFSLSVVNFLWRILTGERLQKDDTKIVQIRQGLHSIAGGVLEFGSLKTIIKFFYPRLAKLLSLWTGFNIMEHKQNRRLKMFEEIIREHKTTLQKDSPRDFIDVYLNEMSETTNVDSSFSKHGLESLKAVMADLFFAASDTTSVTLSWLHLPLLNYPKVQEKMRAEVERVVGRTRLVTVGDRKMLPYTEAVIMEYMRLASVSKFGAPRRTVENTMIRGYKIPKGTAVISNFYATHHDPEVWGPDAEEFIPGRFLSPDGTQIIKHESLIPFSAGRRVCLGETMARDTVFLFVTNLVLNFEVIGEVGKAKPSLEFARGRNLATPKSTRVIMKIRLD